MRVSLAYDSRELFGGDAPEHVRPLIDAAREAPREYASSILWTAQALAPHCLPIYYLLYKLHAGRGELDQAERAARAALDEAGRAAGLPRTLGDELAISTGVDFDGTGPARFWLFTLKALAFICVRRGELDEAERCLGLLARCDPSHSVGSEVTLAFLNAAQDDRARRARTPCP